MSHATAASGAQSPCAPHGHKHRFHCPDRLLARAAGACPVPTGVVAAASRLALESARRARDAGLIEPVLVGDRTAVRDLAAAMDWPLDGVRVVHAADEGAAARAAVALARGGEVQVLMKGHVHTDVLMTAALDRQHGLRAGRRFTHAFHMTVPGSGRELVITDAAVNIAPDLDTKRDIIRNAVDLCRLLGSERPRVALLSCTEEVTDRVPSSRDARLLTEWSAGGGAGEATVYGPLALDLALSAEAARIKGLDHPVAGRADVLVVPNIETGNALFKMMVHFMNATAAGVVLGARVPIVITSRADPPEARIAAAAIASVLARRGAAGLQ
ncbi:bifunctional enoyl-CoA hydratase/phosphate acetyltransferase [Azospirillum sp. ST 5-10]|uniref:bifunctional enoyl-CoA hydratase/phosphate acetyltransferase n=1 Tax=unclassified Azospirillum TaxID=2630922 RepID=UPI003F4A4AA2